MICNRQNIDNGVFTQVFTLLKIKLKENFNLKIKLTETKFEQSVLYKICKILSAGTGEISSGRRDIFKFAFKEKHKKMKKYS